MTRDVLLGIEIESEPKVVYDTIASPEGLAAFWTSDVRRDEGGELSFGFESAPTRLPASILTAEPPSAVAWRFGGDWPAWPGTIASWSLEASDRGTRVTFRHGFPDPMPEFDFGSVALTWALIVARLKDVVGSGGAPDPVLR